MQILWAAFLLGMAGSMHCIIMCGPLISLSSTRYGNLGQGLGTILYQGGRIISYLAIGLVFGIIGQFLSLLFYQQILSVISGILLLIWALFYFIPTGNRFSSGILRIWSRTTSGLFSKLWKQKTIASVLGLGILNGFLPCGLVYLAASASLNQGSILYSLTFMFLFGLGTLPAILGLILSKKLFPSQWRIPIRKLTPYLLVILGSLFILRGMDLNIPYISPHIVQAQAGHKTISAECCGKPDKIIR